MDYKPSNYFGHDTENENAVPKVKVSVTSTGSGFSPIMTPQFEDLLDIGLTGGASTGEFMERLAPFATFASHLQKEGAGAFTEVKNSDGSLILTASDGETNTEM